MGEGDRTYAVQVLYYGQPVQAGAVSFGRCERVADRAIMPWVYCGVLLTKGRRRLYDVFSYDAPVMGPDAEGRFEVTLEGWADWAHEAERGVWGLGWAYDAGDGRRAEKVSKFWSLAYDGFYDLDECRPDS